MSTTPDKWWIRVNKNPHFRNARGIIVSDIAGAGVGMGGMYLTEALMPEQLAKLEKVVGNGIVKYIPGIERYGPSLTNLSEAEAKAFKDLSPEEQGKKVGKSAVQLLISGVLSLGSGLPLHNWIDHHYGNGYGNESITKARKWDYSVQIGSTILVNTLGNKYAGMASHTLSKILQKTFGVTKERADYIGSYLVRFEGPNLLGNITNFVYLHKFGKSGGLNVPPSLR